MTNPPKTNPPRPPGSPIGHPGDRRAVALRQQHDRQLQRLRAEGRERERGALELREALEEELQEPLDAVKICGFL